MIYKKKRREWMSRSFFKTAEEVQFSLNLNN